jgi:arsenate reductase
MTVKIYHNPKCSKSRETLAILEEKGVAFEVLEYLKTPPTEKELSDILKMLGQSPRAFMRKKEGADAGLDNADLSDAELIKGMLENPRAIERPIVVNKGQARVGRPPECVLEIL